MVKNDCKCYEHGLGWNVDHWAFFFFSVGDSAKHNFHSNPSNTIFDAKRLMGRKMDDRDIKRDMKHWPFKVQEKNGKPAITVQYKGEPRDFVRSPPLVFLLSTDELLCSRLRKSVPWSLPK
jgi:hypothetical protein